MGRRRLDDTTEAVPRADNAIQVVSRVFDILRCFEYYGAQLGNNDIADRCKLPRSTVSRLTQTLTGLGQLVYLPQEQKYRLGPSAIAMSTTMLQGLQFRSLLRERLQKVAETIPGTIGFVVPDKFDMVYLECARTDNAVGLNYTVGTRISIARTAAGLAYASAMKQADLDALLRDMGRENIGDRRELASVIEHGREFLARHGYVVSQGRWNEHITGCAVPLWSEQYRTFLVLTVGVLSTLYGQRRLQKELAPQVLNAARELCRISEPFDGEKLTQLRSTSS